MKRSKQSECVLCNVPLTHRHRLMPQIACSTLTRTWDKARLCRFSPGIRSLPRGFFRLMKLLDRRFITLKICILVQHCLARISRLRFIGHLFVMSFVCLGGAKITRALRPGAHNNNILVTAGFLLATIVQSLFLSVFWPLASSFCTINDVISGFRLVTLRLGKVCPSLSGMTPSVVSASCKIGNNR